MAIEFDPKQPTDSRDMTSGQLAQVLDRVDAALEAETARPRIAPPALKSGPRIRGEVVDEHDVLAAFGVQCSAVGDAIRMLLTLGRRGRPRIDELDDAQASISRAIELERDRVA